MNAYVCDLNTVIACDEVDPVAVVTLRALDARQTSIATALVVVVTHVDVVVVTVLGIRGGGASRSYMRTLSALLNCTLHCFSC